MVFQEGGDFDSVFEMPFHPEMQRLGAAIGEEAVEGRRNGAGSELNEAHALSQRRVLHRNRAHQNVRMTIHVLRARMEHDVRA